MRTTLTIDDDLATLLRRLQEKRRAGFKETVNNVLRAGLAALTAPARPRPVAHPTRAVRGEPRLADFDNVAEVLSQVEGDAHR